MMRSIVSLVGVFFVLHGLVHLLYVAHSQRLLELQEGMDWPVGSWALSKSLGAEATRWLATIVYAVAAIGLLAGGVGLIARQAWWRPASIGAAALSAVMVVLLWDGKLHDLDDQGLFALLIDAAILAVTLLLGWPAV